MSGYFDMQTYGPYRLLNIVAPGLIQGSLTCRGGGVKDLSVVSAAKWCPFLSVGADTVCKTNYIECGVSSGPDYRRAFSAALSQWAGSMSGYSRFGNLIPVYQSI